MRKTKRINSVMAFLLALVMIASTFSSVAPITAYAEETGTDATTETYISEKESETEQESETSSDRIETEESNSEVLTEKTEKQTEEKETESDEASNQDVELNTREITGESKKSGVAVQVVAPAGSFPEGTTVSIDPYTAEESADYVKSVFVDAQAAGFNITFKDADGNAVQPEDGKTVKLTFTVSKDSALAGEVDDLRIYHIENDNPELMGNKEVTEKDGEIEITVDATEFSPYVIMRASATATSKAKKAPASGSSSFGGFAVSLLYSDKTEAGSKTHQNHYVWDDFFGTLKIEPLNLDLDAENVVVKVSIPKEYVEKKSLAFNMSETLSSTYDVYTVEEDSDNYIITMNVTNYVKTESIEIPFTLKMAQLYTPQDYELNVSASVSYNGKTYTADTPLTYKTTYQKPGFSKRLTSNSNPQVQNTIVYLKTELQNGKQVVTEDAAVTYAFAASGSVDRWRAASKYRIVDELPTYTDVDGNTRTAKFDPALNPGWTLSSDGKSVYYEVDVTTPVVEAYSNRVSTMQAAVNSLGTLTLKLGFPGMVVENDTSLNGIANTAHYEYDIYNPGPNEDPTVSSNNNTLNIRLTSEAKPVGQFNKTIYGGTMVDNNEAKSATKRWTISLRNTGSVPYTNLAFHDVQTATVAGLDSRMKFTTLTINTLTSGAVSGTSGREIDYVEAYYEDGTTENLTLTAESATVISAKFDENKVAVGFEIFYKNDFELEAGKQITIYADTVLKDPSSVSYDANDALNNNFTNEASVSYGTGTGADETTDSSKFVIGPVDEYLKVQKWTNNNGTANQKVGSTIRFQINITGSLLSKVNKDYGKIQIIDLLPNDVKYKNMLSTDGWNLALFDADYEPTIVENYQNTGRTAIIFETDQDRLLKQWANQGGSAYFYFDATIKTDAHTGTVVNDIYVSADGLDDMKDKTQLNANQKVQDNYDLDKDGNTEEYIAHASSNVSINVAASMYSEKQIANKGQDNWNKNSVTGGPGDEIQYKLTVNNEITSSHTGLVMYDVLPAAGDKYLSNNTSRGSNIHVALTGPVSVPVGYTAYYTTSDSVYSSNMNTAVNASIWETSVSDWSAVTAVKVVADSGTTLNGSTKIEVLANAKLPESLTASQLNELTHVGTNTFAYYTDQSPAVKESNEVKATLTLGTIHVKKTNADGDALSGVTFQLYDSNNTLLQTKTTDSDGFIEFNNLLVGNYTLKETAALTGYKKVGDIAVTVTQNATNKEYSATAKIGTTSLDGRGTDNDPLIVVNEIETVTIEGTKTWDDANNQDGKRPTSITVRLFNGSTEVDSQTVTADANGEWKYSFEAPKYVNGQVAVYTIKEDTVSDYTTSITGYNIKNSYTPETITISGAKTWDDNNDQDGVRPSSITVRLHANGTEVAHKTVTATDNWTWNFTNMPKYADGNEITYTITEDAVADYTSEYDGFDVTNTHDPGKTTVSITKAWDDANNQDGLRPNSVTVKLYADGEDTNKTLVLTEANGWAGTFTDLDEKKAGQAITYTVKEADVDGYTSEVTGTQQTGYTITNTHEPEVVEVNGTKTWKDKNNQDGVRPDSITIRLYANGSEVKNTAVSADENWKYSFKDLPKYENGVEITYSITEDAVADYTTEYDGADVINTHNPGKTTVSVTKAWNDKNNQDGKRAESVTVHLYADGEDTGKKAILSEADNWTATFTNLDEKKAGKQIVYTVKEDEVTGYTSEITGDAATGFTITNSYTPETIKVEGSKTWDDKNDQDGKRPQSIKVNLLANGTIMESKTVKESDNWSYTFDNLPKYESGKEIVYTITEDAVADYTTTYDGYNITNSYTPGKTSVTVTKAWNDSNDKDGIRPKSIQVQLYVNGEKVGNAVTLTADKNWTYTWTDLDVKANKKDIVYSVKEVSDVDGYTKDEGEVKNGNVTITNSHTPKVTNTPSTSKTNITSSPKTGDSTNPVLYAVMFMISLLALLGFVFFRRKSFKN